MICSKSRKLYLTKLQKKYNLFYYLKNWFAMKKVKLFIAGFAFFAVLSLPNYGFCSQGTLLGNDSGTSYCCCPGSNGCGAIECPKSVCGNPIE